MRLGILAGLLTLGLGLSAAPTQARPASSAQEAVSAAIDGITGHIGAVRGTLDGEDRTAMVGSLQRDRAVLREVRADLRDGAPRAERKAARRTAGTVLTCSVRKYAVAVYGTLRLVDATEEIEEGAQAALDAYDPEAPEAEQVEELVAQARASSQTAQSRMGVTLAAFAAVRCQRPAFEEANASYESVLTAVWDGLGYIQKAIDVIEGSTTQGVR